MPTRLCFVGYGAIARHHAEIFTAEGATLHTVVGRAPLETARFAEEFGFSNHTLDLAAALTQADIDAVIITSPNDLHFEQARLALLAGKHALVEIPLAMTYAEASTLVDLARSQGLFLMVAHSQRFIPTLAATQRRVAEGELQVHHLFGNFGLFRRDRRGWTGRERNWTDNLLWHHGCHAVDFALWLLGAEKVQVSAQVSRPSPQTGIPMDLDILLRTDRDQLVSLSLSYNTHLRFHEYVIIGQEDTVRFDWGRLIGADGVREAPDATGLDYNRQAWEAQDREFLAALSEGREPAVSGASALPALAVLQEIQNRFVSESAVGKVDT